MSGNPQTDFNQTPPEPVPSVTSSRPALVTPIRTSDLMLAQHAYGSHAATVPMGTNPKDLENPKWWVHVAHKMRPFDEIRVIPEDVSYVARLFVRYVEGTTVAVRLLDVNLVEPVTEDVIPKTDYDLKLRGTHKWCIVKIDTGEVVVKGIPNHPAAVKELDQFVKTLTR